MVASGYPVIHSIFKMIILYSIGIGGIVTRVSLTPLCLFGRGTWGKVPLEFHNLDGVTTTVTGCLVIVKRCFQQELPFELLVRVVVIRVAVVIAALLPPLVELFDAFREKVFGLFGALDKSVLEELLRVWSLRRVLC